MLTLSGRCIGVTRAEAQAGAARQLFERAGASVVDLPALVIGPPDTWGPLDDALDELEHFHWLIFSSSNGVDAVEQRLQRRHGSVADSLIEHFPSSAWGLRLLLPRVQSGGRTLLAEAFGEAGARVVEVAAYETRCPDGLPSAAVAALERGKLDALTFSSAKTVHHTVALLQGAFGSQWPSRLENLAVVSIGPQTSRACLELLGRVDAEASPHELEGLVLACQQVLGQASA